VNVPTIIAVNSASPYRTLADLINAARAKPGELTLAGTPSGEYRLAFEMLKRAAKVDITYVPYPGAPMVNALLGEHVTSVFMTYSTLSEQLKAGTLRALATGSPTRIEPLPELPTVAESGYKESEADQWYSLYAPAKTPTQAISRLAGWFTAALQAPQIKAKLAGQGLYPAAMCGAEFGAFLRKQYDDYGRLIREANIKEE
jgi:tripartite-type tricarboxylate transporter receptor subunit TctC